MEFTQDQFDTALGTFVEGCARIYNEYMERTFPTNNRDTFGTTRGKKFVRVIRNDGYGTGRSVHCFVDTTTGDVLKAASWHAPAKHARGNIFDESNGLARMKWTGPEYLR